MGFVDRWLRQRGYVPAAEVDQRVKQARRRAINAKVVRSFAAAKNDASVYSWVTGSTTVNQDLFQALRQIRARARDLAENQDYAKAFLRRVKDNVVGPTGVALQVKALQPDQQIDKLDSASLEMHFAAWAKLGNCEVTGRLSWRDLQNLAMELVARDGECLVRQLRGKKFGPYGYQLQFLEIGSLDEEFNNDMANGNKVRMSVELDQWRKPVAYWLRTDNPLDLYGYSYSQKRIRVPADEILHLYLVHDVDQIRGIPWMHTGMLRLHQLGDFEEYAVIAAKCGAGKMGFFTSDEDDDAEEVQSRIAERNIATQDGAGEVDTEPHEYYQEAAGNHFDALPRGVGFETYDPTYPHEFYDKFMKTCLRGIAAGLGVNYNAIAQDWESVNFSSARAALGEERDIWRGLQTWLVERLHDAVYPAWLEQALLSGKLAPMPVYKFDKFNAASWRPRRWQSIKPYEDAQTATEEINLGIASRTRKIIERDDDPEEIWAELESEAARLKDILPPKPAPASAGASTSGASNNANANA